MKYISIILICIMLVGCRATPASADLTQGQIDAIRTMLDGDPPNLNTHINTLVEAREDIHALLRIHADTTDQNATIILGKAKTKASTAASAITTMLS